MVYAANNDIKLIIDKNDRDFKVSVIWVCNSNHFVHATLSRIKNTQWCPDCTWGKNIFSRQKAIELAQNQSGDVCVDDRKYEGAYTLYMWKCTSGHIFLKRLIEVWDGEWCRTCEIADKRGKDFSNDMLWYMAIKNEVFLLDFDPCVPDIFKMYIENKPAYMGLDCMYIWKCNKDHIFTLSFKDVFFADKWCVDCIKECGSVE